MKRLAVFIGVAVGVCAFFILNLLDLNFAYNFFNLFYYGFGQDKFITIGFIAFGLSFLFWIFLGAFIGWLLDRNLKN